VYNNTFDHPDGMMHVLAKGKIQWKEDMFFAVKLAGQKLSKYYAEVTSTIDMLLIKEHFLDPIRTLRMFSKWDKGMDINPEDETSYTTQYQQAFLKYVGYEFCAKYQCVPANKLETLLSSNFVSSAMASGFCL
jgi:hypothetical protein